MTDAEYAVTVAMWFAGYMVVACVVMYVSVRTGYDDDSVLVLAAFWPIALVMGALLVPLCAVGRLAQRRRERVARR